MRGCDEVEYMYLQCINDILTLYNNNIILTQLDTYHTICIVSVAFSL